MREKSICFILTDIPILSLIWSRERQCGCDNEVMKSPGCVLSSLTISTVGSVTNKQVGCEQLSDTGRHRFHRTEPLYSWRARKCHKSQLDNRIGTVL